jgi:hypothetical protein
MGDDLRITVIATGFERSGVMRSIQTPVHTLAGAMASAGRIGGGFTPSANGGTMSRTYETVSRDTDIDVPTFLRNRLNK